MDSDDEPLTLSAHALAALNEFKKEEKEITEKYNILYGQSEKSFEQQQQQASIDAFQEDWQLSQFWYADSTAQTLGRAILDGADDTTVIAIASAPSVYAAIRNFSSDDVPTKHIYLLEYDKRFEVLAGKSHYSFYDYNEPEVLPTHLVHKCDRVLIDPPFLEEDCQMKSARAALKLLKDDRSEKTKMGVSKHRIISSTGERMREVVKKSYPGVQTTDFFPEHKNGLSNEFRCYANFECGEWKFIKDI